MKIPYLTFLKHAEKVVKEVPESRPTMRGVYHNEGYVYVTDSFRLYKAKSEYGVNDGDIIEIALGRKLDGVYPDVERVIPTGDPLVTIQLNIKHTLDVIKALQQAGTVPLDWAESKTRKKDVVLCLDIDGKYATISTTRSAIKAKYDIELSNTVQDQYEIFFNSNYMVQALELFKDVFSFDGAEVTLNVYGKMSPLTLSTEDSLLALICPINF